LLKVWHHRFMVPQLPIERLHSKASTLPFWIGIAWNWDRNEVVCELFASYDVRVQRCKLQGFRHVGETMIPRAIVRYWG
jgi:hypothetical protein